MKRLLLCAALLAVPLHATTWPDATTRDLVASAERVCCAVCESSEARTDPATGIVFTHVRLRLLEDIKGKSPSSTIELRVVGGRDGPRTTLVAGMPRFLTGCESVLLLGKPNLQGYPVVLQGKRGVIPLLADAQGRRHLGGRVTGYDSLGEGDRVSLDAFRGALRKEARR